MSISDIRFKRLGYLALNVTDLKVSRDFYVEMVGLELIETGNPDVVFLRCSDQHHDLMLTQGKQPGLKRVAWEMENGRALAAVREHMNEIGIETLPVAASEAATLGLEQAFRMTEPTTGLAFEFFLPALKNNVVFQPTHTKIARLGHVVINSTDRDKTEKFMLDHLNFRVSDRIGPVVTFMRAFPNPFHHSFAVTGGAQSGLNHVNFMVTDLDDVGKASNRAKSRGTPIVYGIGKHPPSESIFLYFLCPDGMTVEFSFGMEEFPEESPREARMMPPTLASIDYWGGLPDPRMGKGGVFERLGTP
jgi:2,3-dihydroxy-p-cumate/2,3-dihydroxybenzoate 3,4-dioxygenase